MTTALFGQQVYPRGINPQVHGLRGLSVLIVFIYHVYGISSIWHFWPPQFDDLSFLFRLGSHGVDLFFIISGYVITGSLIRHRSTSEFLIDRCIRIYPVFLLIHLLVFGLGPIMGYRWLAGIQPDQWALNFVSNLFLLPGIFDLPLAQPSAWSLSYEAAFYLASAAVYIVATRLGRAPAILAGIAASALFLLPYPRTAFFLVGAAIFGLTRINRTATPASLRASSLALLILMLFLLVLAEDWPVVTYLACLPAFGFFLSILDGRCFLSRVLRLGFFQYLGTISYSFYLWFGVATYQLKSIIATSIYPHVGAVASVIIFAVIGFLLTVAVSHVSNLLLEVRLGRWLRQRTNRRQRLVMVAM